MALKAGYKGVKKSFMDKLTTLLSAKVIKSIGNGLSLSEQGALAAEIDTETMEFKTGKLAAKIPEVPPSFDIELVYDAVTNPVTDNTSYNFVEDIDDYDAVAVVLTTEQDGGISTSQWLFVNFNEILKLSSGWTQCLYKERWFKLSIDFTDNSFKYVSSFTSESGLFKPILCYIYGIKF